MWGPESPRSDSSPCPSRPSAGEPLPSDSLQSAAPQRDGLLQPPSSSVSRDSLESPCSPPAPPSSLGSLPGSSSFPSDSLEQPEGAALASSSFDPGDSLDPAAAPLCRAALRPLFSLNDTLETSSIPRDSLQSASSTQASSLPSDSLESPCSLFDSLETSLAQYSASGSRSV